MRHLPLTTYSGLTVIIDKPSRFDFKDLISGQAGMTFDNSLLANPKYSVWRQNIEIRTLDEVCPYLVNTKCLLLMGEQSSRRYMPDASVMELRGSPFRHKESGLVCVSTFGPQDAHDRQAWEIEDNDGESNEASEKSTHGATKRQNMRFWLKKDIQKAVRLTREGWNEPTYGNIHLYPDPEFIINKLSNTREQDFYFDIETESNFQLTCFGFSFGDDNTYVVPMMQTHTTPRRYYYDDVTTARLLRALCVALNNNRAVIHNAGFDLLILAWRYHLPIGRHVFDTLLSHNRNYIEVEKSLGHCISLYTDLPYHKNEGIFEPHNTSQTESLYTYNAKDVYALTQLKPAIEKEGERLKSTESIHLVNRMVVPYLTMSLQGMNVDWEHVESIVATNKRRNIQIGRILDIITSRKDFNPNSPKQVASHIYDDHGIKRPLKDLTNEKTLLQLLLKHDLGAIKCILKYRGISKQSSKVRFTPYTGLFGSSSRLFSTSWNLAGTTSMRLASRKMVLGCGDNAQNFEKKLRKIIVAPPGYKLVHSDQSGAEALIVAYLCRAGKFRDLFLNGIKPHTYVAIQVFAEQLSKYPEVFDNKTLMRVLVSNIKDITNIEGWKQLATAIADTDKWESSKRYYFIAKMLCHASNYAMQARAFRLNVLTKSEGALNLSLEQCERMLEKYHALFPEIREWHANVVSQVLRTRILTNLFGHPRVFTGLMDESVWKEWYAQVPQSTVGQITNIAITEIQEEMMDKKHPSGINILINGHDSILAQSLNEHVDYTKQLLTTKLNRRLISPRGEEFFMKSEVHVGENWGMV